MSPLFRIVACLVLGAAPGVSLAQGISLRVNNVYQVASTGTDQENCQALRDTLAALDSPGSQNRYVVRLEPGTFACGSSAVVIPEGVVLEGMGRDQTTLSGAVDSPLFGVAHLSGVDTGLRGLTVANTAPTSSSGALIIVSAWSFAGPVAYRIEEALLNATPVVGGAKSILGIDSAGLVTRSELLHGLDLEESTVTIDYSTLIGSVTKDAMSTATCFYCRTASALLDSDCAIVP